MARQILTAASALTVASAAPALAATGPFFSLGNTDFVVLIAFLIFIGILVYFKVPQLLLGLLDKRAESIRSDLDEARALREEAQTVLAGIERKQKEVQEQADRIVAQARDDAQAAAKQAKADLEHSIARRLQTAEEQIDAAETGAVRSVRDRAIAVASAAAAEVIAKQMTDAEADALIDQSIKDAGARLH